ncbi:uncharacterized protein K444DRAFT_615744 [Hyaloscypha bicolor E]|jgi:hypothetical protein|uniref:Uncharacterized protein n=1 Tax=Hyaloscypha bicolor E TaxID=1095630 RepID=A0A2J6T2P0_9HELO|nr:uncharacterized protein K444DRAFT_615744 [Hyaloscypha bicolor E]PMD57295.1 hypothetical protein K444DRAFT_615744 [Hyaloscypha bicolor E]
MRFINPIAPANAFLIACLNASAAISMDLDWRGEDRCEEEGEGEKGAGGLHREYR